GERLLLPSVPVAALLARSVELGPGHALADVADRRGDGAVASLRGRPRRVGLGTLLHLEHHEYLAHPGDASLGDAELDDARVTRRRDGDGRLVGHHLDERIVLG